MKHYDISYDTLKTRRINHVIWLPQSKSRIVTCDSLVQIWELWPEDDNDQDVDKINMKLLHKISLGVNVHALSFSNCETTLACGLADGSICLVSVEGWKSFFRLQIFSLPKQIPPPPSSMLIIFSPISTSYVVAFSYESNVNLIEFKNGV